MSSIVKGWSKWREAVGTDLVQSATEAFWAEVIARDCLFAGVISQPAVASQFSKCQIRNPPESSRVVFVASIKMSATLATFARVGRSDTALSTDVTTFGSMALGGESGLFVDMNRASSASQTFASSPYFLEPNLATVQELIHPQLPFRLAPGAGLLIECTAQNVGITANILGFEFDL